MNEHHQSDSTDPSWVGFANRLRRMSKHLGKWARRQGITCYRLYDHDLPDHPAIIDRYHDSVVVWSKRRTRDETDANDKQRVRTMLAMVDQILQPQRLIHKRRQRQRGRQQVSIANTPGQYHKLNDQAQWQTVSEQGLRFTLNLNQYLDVGLFLDHRPTRQMARDLAANARVLNLYAYTGSFSVYCAAGGARGITTVDLNRQYLDWAQTNMRNNGFSGGQYTYVRSDSQKFIAEAITNGQHWDLIICDPPTFSNSKALLSDWSVDRDHPQLLTALSRLLAKQGQLIFSTNSRRFVFQPPAGMPVKDLTAATTDPDFARRPAHKCWLLSNPSDK